MSFLSSQAELGLVSFPEVVLSVRFRWQQFTKYIVPTVQNFLKHLYQ